MNNYVYKIKKYIKKIKNQSGGIKINYEVAFLWINKIFDKINESNKNNIVTKLKRWNDDNKETKIYLYLDYEYTLVEDIEYFKSFDYIIVINLRDIISYSKELLFLFNIEHPLYMKVDILKILIQYSHLSAHQNDKENYYIVISDIDIMRNEDIPTRKIICETNPMPDFKEDSIFDETTLMLLEYFGYVMTRNREPENGFMIMKNDKDIINGLKNFFIEKIMKDILYNMFFNKVNSLTDYEHCELFELDRKYNLCTQFIYNCYRMFGLYINLLKKYNKFQVIIDDTKIFVEDSETFWKINNTYKGKYSYKKMNYFIYCTDITQFEQFSNLKIYLTSLGESIHDEFMDSIYPYNKYLDVGEIDNAMMPTKCIKIEGSLTGGIDNKTFCKSLYST